MNELVTFEQMAPDYSRPMSAIEIRAQVNLIQAVMREVMVPGVHFGFVPGTEPKTDEERKWKKPALYKPGAEKLCVALRLDPQFNPQLSYDGNHLTVLSTCTLFYIPNGRRVASGIGMCSTHESKYAYRWSKRRCPACDQETIIKGRAEFGGGWLCFGKKGGCGQKFQDGDSRVEQQEAGRVANEDLADQWNTALKMAAKRSHVAATLAATAASDLFHQDIEDLPEEEDYAPGSSRMPARPEVNVQQPQRKHSEPAANGHSPSGQSNGGGAPGGGGPFKPMLPQMKAMIEARLKNAGLTKVDLEAKFSKKLDATDAAGFAFADYNDVEAWVSANAKK